MEKNHRHRINDFLFVLALIALVFANNDNIPLWNADEAAYAGIAKTMYEQGDLIDQHFFQSDVHRKPPFHFWTICLSYLLFGINEWAVRFSSGISILLTALLLYKWIRKEKNALTGKVTAGIFVSNFFILGMAKIAFVDAHLILFSTLLAYALYLRVVRQKRKVFMWIFWCAMAMGILTKGPQIIIFSSLLALGVSLWVSPLKTVVGRLEPWIGIPIALLPLAIWGYLSHQKDGGALVYWMWDWYIVRRAQGDVVFNQTGPPGYYLLNFLVAFAPFVVGFFLLGSRLAQKGWLKDPLRRFLLIWIGSGWLIYEIIPSKLPTYVAAAYPGWAILLALLLCSVSVDQWKSAGMKIGMFFQILLSAILGAALIYMVQGQFGLRGLLVAILSGLTLIIGAIVYVLQLEKSPLPQSAMTLVWSGILFGLLMVMPMMNMISEPLSCPRRLAEDIQLEVKKSDPILLAKEDIHMVSLPFYLSEEGRLEQVSDRQSAIQRALNKEYKIIIADSSFIPDLQSKYQPHSPHTCFDINTGKNNEYLIFSIK